jgi:hypothetical protein
MSYSGMCVSSWLLQHNELEGSISENFSTLTGLTDLSLAHNQLVSQRGATGPGEGV